MKYIEGFIICRHARGAKKGQEYVRRNKTYNWYITRRLENEVEIGDVVLVEVEYFSEAEQKHLIRLNPALVTNIYESERNEHRNLVKKIVRKHNKNKEKESAKKYKRISDDDKQNILDMRAKGKKLKEIAEIYSYSISTIHRIISDTIKKKDKKKNK